MSNFFFVLIVVLFLSLPIVVSVLALICLVRFLQKKPVKKLLIGSIIYVGSIIPLSMLLCILSAVTDPATWCEHQYEVAKEVAPTCVTQGEIHRRCPLCSRGEIEYVDALGHSWSTDVVKEATCTAQGEAVKKCTACGEETHEQLDMTEHVWKESETISADCINAGYVLKQCEKCANTQRTENEKALGHKMTEISRVKATYEKEGEIVKRCDRCGHEEKEKIPKLEYVTVEFNGLELAFGEYSFTEIDNMFSEHNHKPIVRIPVTVKNISKSPNSLLSCYYTLFGSTGTESAYVGYYFNDDVCQGGELLAGKSYTRYFYIVYDGDGVYTILLNDLLFEKETVEINITK